MRLLRVSRCHVANPRPAHRKNDRQRIAGLALDASVVATEKAEGRRSWEMNGGIGDCVATIQIGAVPLGGIGGCGISVFKKIQDLLGWIGRLAHLVVVQDKLS